MKKSLAAAFMLLAALAFVSGCDNSGSKPQQQQTNKPAAQPAEAPAKAAKSEAQKLMESVAFTEEGLNGLFKAPDAMSAVEFEASVLALAQCEMKRGWPDNACPALKVVRGNKRKLDGKAKSGVIRRLWRADSPAVRGYAQSQSGRIGDEAQLAENVALLKAEKDPYVLAMGLGARMNDLRRSADLTAVVREAAKHKDVRVRRAAVRALSTPWSKGVDGVGAALVSLLNDQDEGIVCRAISGLQDDALVPEIEKVLNNPEAVRFHGDCADALLRMWYGFPLHEDYSPAAYKAYVNYLRKTPRTEQIPARGALAPLGQRNQKTFADWPGPGKGFRAADFIAVLGAVVRDGKVDWRTRNAAVKGIATFGGKNDLTALKRSLARVKIADEVKQELDKAIEKAQ